MDTRKKAIKAYHESFDAYCKVLRSLARAKSDADDLREQLAKKTNEIEELVLAVRLAEADSYA